MGTLGRDCDGRRAGARRRRGQSRDALDSTRRAPLVAEAPASQAATPAGDADGFEALSEEHFERSKLVVLGLATKDPAQVTSADWTYERDLAATLLTDTRMYRMAAEDRGLGRSPVSCAISSWCCSRRRSPTRAIRRRSRRFSV